MNVFQGSSISLSADLNLYSRFDFHPTQIEIIDTIGSNWMLAWFEQADSNFQIFIDGQFTSFQKNHFLFMPPYSIIRWKMGQGWLHWKAYVSYASTFTLKSASKPLLVHRDLKFNPTCAFEIFEYIKRHSQETKLVSISEPSQIAFAVKSKIDVSFRDDLFIEDLSLEFDISRTTLFRAFKEHYLFSPTQYRQRLRLFEAIKLITLGESMTASIYNSGFTDISEFSKQFKIVFYTSPKKFLNR